MKSTEEKRNRIKLLGETHESISVAIASELDGADDLAPNTAEDISARYWLMTFLEPLNRKELKSIVDGFLVPMLSDDQAKKIVKFLLARFPHYYQDFLKPSTPEAEPAPVIEQKSVEVEKKLELPKEFLPEPKA
jgi:hypothetical protein